LVRLEREVYRRGFRSAFEPVVIIGEPGVGKSAFAAAFCEGLSGRERAIWIPCRDWEPYVLPFERLLRDRFVEPREALVVLDGADEVEHASFFDLFRRVSNFKLVRTLVITSRTDPGIRGQREFALERLSPAESAELLRQSLALSNLDSGTIDALLASVNGHPLATGLVANMVRALSPAQLRQVLSGQLYDLNDIQEKRELVAAAKPIIISANEAMVRALKKRPEDIFTLTPRRYEELIAELLDDMGYKVTLTPATRDGGKDILASLETPAGEMLCLVEAKKYRADRRIGVSMVRTLYGTLADYQANSAMLVTTSTYSKDAHAMQKRHQYQLSLRDYTDVAKWIQTYGRKRGR
jgi:HJR/Mrr/RecB family endonuclease